MPRWLGLPILGTSYLHLFLGPGIHAWIENPPETSKPLSEQCPHPLLLPFYPRFPLICSDILGMGIPEEGDELSGLDEEVGDAQPQGSIPGGASSMAVVEP